MIYSDASKYALGAVLLQEQEVESDVAGQMENRWVTIGYWLKTLISAERNYSTTEREFLSVV